jgi:hypothetical protein
LVENFYGRKIISSETGSYQKFSSQIIWSQLFYGRKIISSKTGSYQKFSLQIFLVENFL